MFLKGRWFHTNTLLRFKILKGLFVSLNDSYLSELTIQARFMFSLQSTPGRTALINEKEYLFFSGYSYLGMNHNPEFKNLVQEGFEIYGALFPSSRISNTALDLYTNAENQLNELTQLPYSVLLPSGFTAGKAAVELIEKDATIFQSPFCHPAIRMGNNSTLRFTDWAIETVQTIHQHTYSSTPVILSDSVNQLTAEVYDFSFLNDIHENIICIIDDSHGIGLIGKNGSGIISQLPRKNNIEYIISYSLSKALNIQAGAISCTNKTTADRIRKSSWYTAVTPPSPALLYAFCNASKIYQKQRTDLYLLQKEFQTLIQTKKGVYFHPDLPVFILPVTKDEDYFEKKGIIISSFAYPDPTGIKLNRAVINALHRQDDLQKLANAL